MNLSKRASFKQVSPSDLIISHWAKTSQLVDHGSNNRGRAAAFHTGSLLGLEGQLRNMKAIAILFHIFKVYLLARLPLSMQARYFAYKLKTNNAPCDIPSLIPLATFTVLNIVHRHHQKPEGLLLRANLASPPPTPKSEDQKSSFRRLRFETPSET